MNSWYYVYFIRSRKDNSYYIGYTNNLEQRIKDHNSGKTKSLKHKIPLDLVYSEAYTNSKIARIREIFLKKNSAAKREIINRISGD